MKVTPDDYGRRYQFDHPLLAKCFFRTAFPSRPPSAPPRKGRNRKKRQHIAMGEVSGDDVHIFLPIVGGLFRQLRLSHKGKAQNIGVGTHAANGIGQDGGRNVQQTVIIIIWF